MNRELPISLKTNLETWISEKKWRLMISIWSICLTLAHWSIKLYQRIMTSPLLSTESHVVMLEIKKRISIETLVNCGSPLSGVVKPQRRPKTMCISRIKLADLHKDHLGRENSKRRKFSNQPLQLDKELCLVILTKWLPLRSSYLVKWAHQKYRTEQENVRHLKTNK